MQKIQREEEKNDKRVLTAVHQEFLDKVLRAKPWLEPRYLKHIKLENLRKNFTLDVSTKHHRSTSHIHLLGHPGYQFNVRAQSEGLSKRAGVHTGGGAG